MNKFFLIFAIGFSNLNADEYFDYNEFFMIQNNLTIIQETVDKYQNIMDYEDYGIIQQHIKTSRILINGKTAYVYNQVK